MTGQARPASTAAYWLFVPITAFGATLVGVVALFYLEAWLLGEVIGTERICQRLECGLGIGVWLIVTGFFTLVASFLAGMVVGVRRRDATPTLGAAARRGLHVATWCTLAYLIASAVIWWPKT